MLKRINPQTKETLQTILIALIWFAIGWVASNLFRRSDVLLFEQVFTELNKNHVDTLPSEQEMVFAGIRGMVASIDDPHAAFISPDISPRVQPDFDGQSGVVGLFPEQIDDQWIITVVLPDQPAEHVGLEEKDVLISVDGIVFSSQLTALEASLILRGPVGESAEIVVQRDGELLTFSPVREERYVVTDTALLENDIAYFAQNTFTANSPEKVKEAIESLFAQNPKALIWDLRSNGGGSMNAAQEILNYFIAEGVLFSVELNNGETRFYEADGDAFATEIPLVVLIGERTYSSAETAASSILDHERGVLIGSESHGKGTVQTTVPLIEDSMLQFTIAHWLSPSGEWFEGRGVPPSIYVEDDPATEVDEVLDAAISYIDDTVISP
ncbi:MAG: PDZ domain-containing protein [Chloroflexi bacterium]|nr:PDZ domain-containing protein [Chloroflexota bacterium]